MNIQFFSKSGFNQQKKTVHIINCILKGMYKKDLMPKEQPSTSLILKIQKNI